MPEVAAALRERIPRIVDLWTKAVDHHIPSADPLTVKEVRNSIPSVLEKIAQALESDRPESYAILVETSVAHGITRFQENYNIEELLIEYRLLRRVTFDELHAATGGRLSYQEAVATDMAIDTSLHQGVSSYVRYLTTQLKSAAAAESKYLAFLSHDLRNNLHGITLTVEWLAQRLSATPGLTDIAEDLSSLQNSITETIDGMDRLLQAERLRRQAVQLKLAPVDLHRLATDLLSQFSRKTTGKDLRLENAVPPDAGTYSDRELLTLVLQNLLGNAVKYSPSGTIRLAAETDPLGWKISVSDQGPGIPPDQLATLFDAFTRGETRGQPGIGLGLNIASHAARLLGSDLRVSSAPGKGSTFSFTAPPANPAVTR
jgi:signal transduction histidine kinase